MKKEILLIGLLVLLVACNQKDTSNLTNEQLKEINEVRNLSANISLKPTGKTGILMNNNYSSLIFMPEEKINVTVLCTSLKGEICFYSENLSIPNYLVPLGNNTYAFKLPIKEIRETYVYP